MIYRTDANGNLIKIAGNSNNGYNGHCLPVGSIFSSAIPQTSNNYHLLNGDNLSISGVYNGFYNLINTLVGQGYNLTCSANEYAEDIAKTGNCGKFVINTTSNEITGTYTDANDNTTSISVSATSFKLPTISMFIQGLSNLTNIGDSMEAGLPNITGVAPSVDIYSSSTAKPTGVFTYSNKYQNVAWTTGNQNGAVNINFDASLSSSIYGHSTTVQPSSTQYPYYIVLLSGSALTIEANPTLSGSEQQLNSLGIGGTNYKTKIDYSTDEIDTCIK